MDFLSMLTSSPIFSGYSNFMNNFGSALGANFATYPFQKKMAKRQYEYQQALQDDAQAHQIYMYQNQNQWRVNDLRSAGLNPILATHAGSSMPSASAGSVGLGSPSHGSTSALNLEHFARLFNNRYKKENDLLDAQIKEINARTGEIKGRSKVSNFVGDIAQEGSSLFSSAKNVSGKFGSFIGPNLGDLFFNRKKYTLPTSGFSARDEKFLDELIKEDDARRSKNWDHVGTRVGNRIYIYKKAK